VTANRAAERYLEIAEPAVRDTIELAVVGLRVVDDDVAFCRPRGGSAAITVGELARMFTSSAPRLHGDDLRAADIVRRHRGRSSEEIAPVLSGTSTRIGWGLLIHTAEVRTAAIAEVAGVTPTTLLPERVGLVMAARNSCLPSTTITDKIGINRPLSGIWI
jgi:hypothetical protein